MKTYCLTNPLVPSTEDEVVSVALEFVQTVSDPRSNHKRFPSSSEREEGRGVVGRTPGFPRHSRGRRTERGRER